MKKNQNARREANHEVSPARSLITDLVNLRRTLRRTGRAYLNRLEAELDEVTAWARDVVRRRVPACRYVRLAARRHLDDLKQGRKRGLLWQPWAAQHRIGFYPRFLRHSKGEWARRPVELSGWQKFVIGSVLLW